MTDDAGPSAKVGYKRPPLHTRFTPGVSGNPRGRQKGVRNFAADVKRTLEIPVRDANRRDMGAVPPRSRG